MLDARTLSAGGNTRNSIAIPTGVMSPPPTPCSTRNTTSSPRLEASPHSAEATVKMTRAPRRTFRPPKRSPSQPEAAMKTPVLTRNAIEMLSTASGAEWKSRPIDGEGHVHDRGVHDRHEEGRYVDDSYGDLLVDDAAAHPGMVAGLTEFVKYILCRSVSFQYDVVVTSLGAPIAADATRAETAREAWEQMRELTHDPLTLGKLHALAEEAGIIPGAAKALKFLYGAEPVPMRRLAADLHCDNSYITTIVDSMEQAGVARREVHPTDRRIKVIVLTDEGRRLAARALEVLGTPPPAFDALTSSETEALRDLMRKLTQEAQS